VARSAGGRIKMEDQVVFWDGQGEPILTITGGCGIYATHLLGVFDTDAMRRMIEAATGRKIDNTSEEFSDEL
jgi:hypothetical protein